MHITEYAPKQITYKVYPYFVYVLHIPAHIDMCLFIYTYAQHAKHTYMTIHVSAHIRI